MKTSSFRPAQGDRGRRHRRLGGQRMLAVTMPSASASNRSLLGLFDDAPATTHYDGTITGVNNAVINVAAPYTYCLVNLKQTGAVNVAPGAALSVTGGSIINGAITLVAAKAFTFCNSSTKQGAINSSRGAGFVLIRNGGDGGLLAAPCGVNHIDRACPWPATWAASKSAGTRSWAA
ncbi:MAG: hypothetical protein QOF20_2620 [Acidimicrobiaceae bacterium]|nr:hypothetical protein [Acidimicrobiaceae bacterium]